MGGICEAVGLILESIAISIHAQCHVCLETRALEQIRQTPILSFIIKSVELEWVFLITELFEFTKRFE